MELMLDKCKNKKNMFNHIVTDKFRDGCRMRKKEISMPITAT
jgi:hypothetical protein